MKGQSSVIAAPKQKQFCFVIFLVVFGIFSLIEKKKKHFPTRIQNLRTKFSLRHKRCRCQLDLHNGLSVIITIFPLNKALQLIVMP